MAYLPNVDLTTNALMTVDFQHHEVHAGDHYFTSIYDSDVDTAAPKYIRITTANSRWSHLLVMYSSTGAGIWEFFENPTLNAAGTSVTIFNNNRNSSNTPHSTVFKDTTTTSDGTLLWTDRTGADGIGGTRSTGGGSRDMEIILKQNEDYILKFTPDSNDAKMIVNFSWYEHKPLA